MRIGLDILYEKPEQSSGTRTYLQGFLQALDTVSCGEHQFFLFANPESIEFCRKYAPNYHTIIFPFTGKGRVIRTILQYLLIPLYSRRYKLDAINFLGTTGAFFTGCATVQHVKTLHHLRCPEFLDDFKVNYLKLMLGPSVRYSDVVIANCAYTKKGIADLIGFSHDKIITINESVDHSIFYSRRKDEACASILKNFGITKPYILFVSTLWRYKNIETLFKAMSQVGIAHDLVVVGDTADHKYKGHLLGIAESYGIRNRVKMVGHIKDRCIVREFYIGADLYVSPSFAETFGLTILESMACGTPVIAANTTSIPEVVGDAGILFDPYDYKNLAECIQRVLGNPALKYKLIQRGLKRAQFFTWNKTAKATLKAYRLSILYYKRNKYKNTTSPLSTKVKSLKHESRNLNT